MDQLLIGAAYNYHKPCSTAMQYNLTCGECQKESETQKHVLATCPAIHNDTTNKIEKYELFSENPEDLKLIYQKLTTTMEKLENV